MRGLCLRLINHAQGALFFAILFLTSSAYTVGFANELNGHVNVLLFSVDSFRPDYIGCYGESEKQTPVIDSIAKKGVVFRNAFSQSAWTTPGMLSIFTSLYPHSHKVGSRGKSLDKNVATLPKALKAQGYSAPAFSYLIRDPNYFNLGFDPAPPELREGKSVDDLFKLLEIYKEKKFFIWFHNKYIHLPYKAHPPYDQLLTQTAEEDRGKISSGLFAVKNNVVVKNGSVEFKKGDKQRIQELYNANVKRLDDDVARLIEKLKELGLINNTLLIITADHGEELLDHGFVGHASTSLSAKLYDEIIHIPLIFYLPGGLEPGRINTQVQQVDIFPTILDMLNIPIPATLQGNSMKGLINGQKDDWPEFALSETNKGGYQSTEEMKKIILTSLRTPDWKVICEDNHGNKEYELYYLKDDPHERNNIYEQFPNTSRLFEEVMDKFKN